MLCLFLGEITELDEGENDCVSKLQAVFCNILHTSGAHTTRNRTYRSYPWAAMDGRFALLVSTHCAKLLISFYQSLSQCFLNFNQRSLILNLAVVRKDEELLLYTDLHPHNPHDRLIF